VEGGLDPLVELRAGMQRLAVRDAERLLVESLEQLVAMRRR
jgi:hypothetical protein